MIIDRQKEQIRQQQETMVLLVGDPLHLWKALRRHFQLHPMMIFEDLPFAPDFKLAKKILSLGLYLIDTSAAGKMKNVYSTLKMFINY